MTNVEIDNYLFNFGFGTKEEKRTVLLANPQKHVFMDLTCFNPQEFYDEYPQLKGSFSALFCDERKAIEFHLLVNDEGARSAMKGLGFNLVDVSFVTTGFIFARTIVQIINEAFFALEDKVASKEDIDRAMKFGVNYPKGPFEWAQGRELVVKTLLSELLQETGDQRYVASKLL